MTDDEVADRLIAFHGRLKGQMGEDVAGVLTIEHHKRITAGGVNAPATDPAARRQELDAAGQAKRDRRADELARMEGDAP